MQSERTAAFTEGRTLICSLRPTTRRWKVLCLSTYLHSRLLLRRNINRSRIYSRHEVPITGLPFCSIAEMHMNFSNVATTTESIVGSCSLWTTKSTSNSSCLAMVVMIELREVGSRANLF